jgi:PAS domain-containing serine/threonine kinase
MDENLAKKIFVQIAQALAYCHKMNVAHRDIKEENVLINSSLQVRLIDFGSATFCKPDTQFKIFFGTLEYASPEVLSGKFSI